MTPPAAPRLPGPDALKAVACMLIVWHHLAFYGPMSDVVHSALPGVMDWLYNYARMAVQLFLVAGGFLVAASLAPDGIAAVAQPGRLILRRYHRLVWPLMVAIIITTGVAALVRPWLQHPSVPDTPTLWQLLAHLLLLQDVLGHEALSAGIWYVAIDFQLFVMTVVLLTLAHRSQSRWPRLAAHAGAWLVPALAAASLLVFNRRSGMDTTGLYFFGSYALGMMAWWAARSASPARWLLAITSLGALALALDFRGRLLVAVLVALALVWLQRGGWATRWLQAPWLRLLGQMSYSVFLIHFSVCLLVNAVVSQFWPTDVAANALGMLAAFVLSLLAGSLLYRGVESRRLPWPGVVRAGVASP